jgi:hypothetical protein
MPGNGSRVVGFDFWLVRGARIQLRKPAPETARTIKWSSCAALLVVYGAGSLVPNTTGDEL